MSCALFRRQWEPGAAEDHALHCAACAAWLIDQRSAVVALGRLAVRLDAARPADREQALLVAYRRVRPAVRPGGRAWAFGLLAAAACVLAATVLVLRPSAPSSGRSHATATPPPASAPVHGASARGSRPSAPPSQESRGHVPRRVRREPLVPVGVEAPHDERAAMTRPAFAAPPAPMEVPPAAEVVSATASNETVADAPDGDAFYPLPDAPRGALESGQIVRVRLRADVLEAAGLPGRAAPAPGPVEAEVLVGPDGVARGIRLARPRR